MAAINNTGRTVKPAKVVPSINLNTPDPKVVAADVLPMLVWGADENKRADGIKSKAQQAVAYALMTWFDAHCLRRGHSDDVVLNAWRKILLNAEGDSTHADVIAAARADFLGKRPGKPAGATLNKESLAIYNAYANRETMLKAGLKVAAPLYTVGVRPSHFDKERHVFVVPFAVCVPEGWQFPEDMNGFALPTTFPLTDADVFLKRVDPYLADTFTINAKHIGAVYLHNTKVLLNDSFLPVAKRTPRTPAAAPPSSTQTNAASSLNPDGTLNTTTAGQAANIAADKAKHEAEIAQAKLVLSTASLASLLLNATAASASFLKRDILPTGQELTQITNALEELRLFHGRLKERIAAEAANKPKPAAKKAA